MHHYIDILVRPSAEFAIHQMMAVLYKRLHRVLAQTKTTTIGVSFPQYAEETPTLGSTLRLFGPQAPLERLMDHDWMNGMQDLITVSAVAPVPANASYRSLRRIQAKSSPERLRRRQIRRHGLTDKEARRRLPDTSAEALRLPYMVIASASTGQRFRLFLELGQITDDRQESTFNAYGLSRVCGVPWF